MKNKKMLEKILKKSWFPLVTRIIFLLGFIFLMFLLYLGSLKLFNIKFTNNWAMFMIWTLWWPFLYLSLLFLARGWCGFFCPLGLANEAGNYLRKGKNVNIKRWSFIAFIIFILVVFWEQASGLFLSVNTTLYFLGLFFGTAFIMGILFNRLIFCRLVCPIGTLLSVFSRLSFLGVRINKRTCSECTTKECIRGGIVEPCPLFNNVPHLNSNRNCLICTNCIKNCPYDSAKLQFIVPGKEIEKKAGFTLGESLFIVSLLGLTIILTSSGTALVRKMGLFLGLGELNGITLRLADFVLVIGITFLIYYLLNYLITRLGKLDYADLSDSSDHSQKSKSFLKENLVSSGYTYLPLVFFVMTFTVVFGFLGPHLGLMEKSIALTKYIFLFVGGFWSLRLVWRLSQGWGKVCNSLFILGLVLLWLLVLIPGPLSVVDPTGTTIEVKAGDVVQMKGFSMGFEPSTIIVQKDTPVVINFSNIDIDHAFDINEFNVHNVIRGGRDTRIMFVPDQVGEFKFYCSIPGHEEAGMVGKLIVKE